MVTKAMTPRRQETPVGGLTTAEAASRRRRYGPNATPEERPRFWLGLLRKFWAPVPWMLELAILLELFLGRHVEAGVVAALLGSNALLGFVQERRAYNALALLRQRLAIRARVLRDGRWQLLPAQDLVPGDVIHLRVGDMTPADVGIASGQVLLDESTLTGESAPVERGPGTTAHAGTVVKRGEATGKVTATGARTAFGKTAELVRLARTTSNLEKVIFTIVKYLMVLNALLVGAVLVYTLLAGVSLEVVLPFSLILLVASVPVALPATFTVATALGSLELAGQGVLVTRLAAIEEAAGMDVLCSDKTGTITENRLAVAALRAYDRHDKADVLRLAALACDEATQDPIDLAILAAAHTWGAAPGRRLQFVPFDPTTKRAEALVEEGGQTLRVVKGAPQVLVAGMTSSRGRQAVAQDVERMAGQGFRVLAVAAGSGPSVRLVGLIALQDSPREDSAQLIDSLRGLSVRVLLVTGDGPATARAVASQVGIGERVCPLETLWQGPALPVLDYDVFAGVLPEDKFHLVQALQQAGHIVGMTGDGVNDAPALKQAEVGIAVANATDVAKAAASLVLTKPGLGNIVAAVRTSRRIYQRMLTYTLNKIIKTCQVALLLSLGLILTGTFLTTSRLVVLLLFANDFVTMSLATDRVAFSPAPNRWRVGPLIVTGIALAALILIPSFGLFFWARDHLRLPLEQLQTLMFLVLVFTGQGMVYLVRERRHCWRSRPSGWLLTSSVLDILVVGVLATQGILMAAVGLDLVLGVLGGLLLYLLALDFLKVRIMKWCGLQ
jgi:H+-transporting ATPase